MNPLHSFLRVGLVLSGLWLAPLFAGTNPAKPNILIVVLDDFGRDMAPGYGGVGRPPRSPFLPLPSSSFPPFTVSHAPQSLPVPR